MSAFTRVTRGRVAGLVSVLCLVSVAADAHAGGLVTVNFQGVVTDVQDTLNIFAAVSVGTTVSGTYTYDGNAPSVNPGTNYRNYDTAVPPGRFECQIGPFLFQAAGTVRIQVTKIIPLGTDHFQVWVVGNILPALGPETARGMSLALGDNTGTALSDLSLPLGAPNLALWTDSYSHVTYSDVGLSLDSTIYWDVTSVTLKGGPGGACSPDSDGDGIQDGVDQFPTVVSNLARDASTTPITEVSVLKKGDQILCASDALAPAGITVESLSGGSIPAKPQLLCYSLPTMSATLYPGNSVTFTCSSAIAEAVAGNIEVELLKQGVVAATLVLPQGNIVIYKPETLAVTAPPSNNTTLILVSALGEQLTLAPGETTVLTSPIPALSEWGIGVMALLLLIGAKIYFNRRRAIHA